MERHIKRYALTLIDQRTGLRRLAFAQQSLYTYATEEEAQEALAVFGGPDGLVRVYSPETVRTLRVDLVLCFSNGDPVYYYLADN